MALNASSPLSDDVMSECIHLLPPGTCATCNTPRTPARRLIEDAPQVVMKARFDARCLRCDETMREGDDIALYRGDWIHLSHFQDGVL